MSKRRLRALSVSTIENSSLWMVCYAADPPGIRVFRCIAAQPALTTPLHMGTKDRRLMGKETKDKLFARNFMLRWSDFERGVEYIGPCRHLIDDNTQPRPTRQLCFLYRFAFHSA